ncbi:MAG: family efflux transporter, subunit [Bacteroidetes bacterium]|jgi:HlyD family secretion protein|nr:family efflux transporter, subunit [Bacteroidota bacterium]
MKKLYWIIGICIAVLMIVIIFKFFKGAEPTKVTTEKAAKRNIIESVSANGKIQPEAELKITSDVSGEIVEMLVKEGDDVKKGQLLCRIKPDIYESNLERVNATVNSSKANLKTAVAQLAQAQANLANAEASYARSKKLFDQNVISQQEFDGAKAAFEAAKANVVGITESINASDYNVKSVEASLKEANTNLDKTYIYAPVDGTVSKLNVEKGERVVGVQGLQGTEILRLANLNEMEASVEVNENDIIRIHKNDTAIIEVDAYIGKKFRGIVTEVANSANTTGISIDQVTNFVVKIRMIRESYLDLVTEENPAPFRPGMSASVDIQTMRAANRITVPIPAVTTRSSDTTKTKERFDEEDEEGGDVVVKDEKEEKMNSNKKEEIKECVFVNRDGVAKMVYVTTGIQDNDFIEIKSGINVGDEVISGPYGAVSKILKDGKKIKVVDKDELFSDKK